MPTLEALHPREKVPPQNIDAEISVLGSILIEEDAIAGAIEALTPETFYKDSHKKIFQALIDLFNQNKPADLITLTEVLDKKGLLEEIGGASYLAFLTAAVPTAANLMYHVKIVK